MDNSSNGSGGYRGIGVTGLLGVVFITLKLCHVITWSWVWVLAPFWAPLLLVLVIMSIALITSFLKERKLKKEIRDTAEKENAIVWELSDREREIIAGLGGN